MCQSLLLLLCFIFTQVKETAPNKMEIIVQTISQAINRLQYCNSFFLQTMGTTAAVALSIWATVLDCVLSQIIVQQVDVGDTAILHCPSNDDNHRFQFWQLQGDQVVGPGNEVNKAKYKYEVLSGTLYIKVR